MEKEKNDLEMIGSIWKNKSKNGVDYFKGKIGGENIVIFKNNKPKNEKSPHYFIFKEIQENLEVLAITPNLLQAPALTPNLNLNIEEDDDIPF
jgi:hypothetical protein